MAGRGLARVGTKGLGFFRKLGVQKLFRRSRNASGRPPHVQRAIDDAMVGTRGDKLAADRARLANRLRSMATAGQRGENPLDYVPQGAHLRVLHPVQGGAQYGVQYSWREAGQKVAIRAHGPDPSAPVGSNAHGGEIYRVQRGNGFFDGNGTEYPRGIGNQRSPHYDPQAINDTHIPWPPQHRLPRS